MRTVSPLWTMQGDEGGLSMPSETNGQTAHHPPSADVYLTQHAVLVELEIPGFAADDLVVAASGHVDVLSAARQTADLGRNS